MMQKVAGKENNLKCCWFSQLQKLHLLYDDRNGIFWLLFLLFLFWKEAGYAFVDKQITTKNQHKESRPGWPGFLFTPTPKGALESENCNEPIHLRNSKILYEEFDDKIRVR